MARTKDSSTRKGREKDRERTMEEILRVTEPEISERIGKSEDDYQLVTKKKKSKKDKTSKKLLRRPVFGPVE